VPVWREWPAYVWRGWPLERLVSLYAGLVEGMEVPTGIKDLPVCVAIAGQVPHAVGVGYACQYKRDGGVALCYFGDGASSHGDCQEALNFAGVLRVPVVFVCTNNQWALSIPQRRQTRAETKPGVRELGVFDSHRPRHPGRPGPTHV
jgi:TPP-dependent pyruvate/acetoin dehydrogenase alpha subunit